jgi:hypothetical protein
MRCTVLPTEPISTARREHTLSIRCRRTRRVGASKLAYVAYLFSYLKHVSGHAFS